MTVAMRRKDDPEKADVFRYISVSGIKPSTQQSMRIAIGPQPSKIYPSTTISLVTKAAAA